MMMMMMIFHLEMISFVTVEWRYCTYLGGTKEETEVYETHVEHNVKG